MFNSKVLTHTSNFLLCLRNSKWVTWYISVDSVALTREVIVKWLSHFLSENEWFNSLNHWIVQWMNNLHLFSKPAEWPLLEWRELEGIQTEMALKKLLEFVLFYFYFPRSRYMLVNISFFEKWFLWDTVWRLQCGCSVHHVAWFPS